LAALWLTPMPFCTCQESSLARQAICSTPLRTSPESSAVQFHSRDSGCPSRASILVRRAHPATGSGFSHPAAPPVRAAITPRPPRGEALKPWSPPRACVRVIDLLEVLMSSIRKPKGGRPRSIRDLSPPQPLLRITAGCTVRSADSIHCAGCRSAENECGLSESCVAQPLDQNLLQQRRV